jgi:hypothetical protein
MAVTRELAIALVVALAMPPAAGTALAAQTMRVDYEHSGTDHDEAFALDRVIVEPLPWPGHPSRAIDDTDLGKYFFEVVDEASGDVLYSRGFSSIFGEWETTAEAQSTRRTFRESLRFPAVERPARIVLKKRDQANRFREVWAVTVDPDSPSIERAAVRADAGPVIAIHEAGDPASKLDILFIGDGYTAGERGKFERDARRLAEVLLAIAPFRERRADINVWGLSPASAESGISAPSRGVERRSAIGAAYDALGLERYVLTLENRAFRDLAAHAPYDAVQIVANSDAYGGGGIFNLYGIVAADSAAASYLFMHEFGHHLAGLADEYFEAEVAYLPPAERVEPWEPNITALLDPAALKWRDLATPDTPIPTPWTRAEPAPAGDGGTAGKPRPASSPFAGRVGAFEGANYQAQGYFRPELDCLMFSGSGAVFCAVCQRGITRIIDLYSRP